MFKKLSFTLSLFVILISLVGCEPKEVKVEVTREIQVEVEVTRVVPVEVEVERVVIVTPAGLDQPAGNTTEDASPRPSVLRIPHGLIWGSEESLDPYAPTRFTEYALLAYERLIRQDRSGNLLPGLASAWEANADGTVWTITLREGVTFHDGSTMGPADVVYSIERMINPDSGSTLAPVLQSIAAVAPAGDNQVTIGLSAPNIEFPQLLTDPRAVILRQNGGDTVDTDGIGTGPYRLSKLELTGITELTAFRNYRNGRPGVDEVAIIAIPDAESQVQAMEAGQIDMLNRVTPDQQSLFANANTFSLQTIPTGDWRGFVMRTDTPPFDDVAVRRALRLVADRQAMVDTVLGGSGTVACDHPVWQGDRYSADIDCPQNIALAQSLLAEAGYPDGVTVDLHTAPLDPYWPSMIAVYQTQAAEAGITVNVIEEPIETFWTDTWLIDPFVTTSWNARPAHLILNEAWGSTAAWNETYWQNSEFDTLLEQAAAEPDLAVRQALYAQLQNILWESGGAFIPFHVNQTRVLSTCIAGVQPVAAEHVDFSLIVKTPNCN